MVVNNDSTTKLDNMKQKSDSANEDGKEPEAELSDHCIRNSGINDEQHATLPSLSSQGGTPQVRSNYTDRIARKIQQNEAEKRVEGTTAINSACSNFQENRSSFASGEIDDDTSDAFIDDEESLPRPGAFFVEGLATGEYPEWGRRQRTSAPSRASPSTNQNSPELGQSQRTSAPSTALPPTGQNPPSSRFGISSRMGFSSRRWSFFRQRTSPGNMRVQVNLVAAEPVTNARTIIDAEEVTTTETYQDSLRTNQKLKRLVYTCTAVLAVVATSACLTIIFVLIGNENERDSTSTRTVCDEPYDIDVVAQCICEDNILKEKANITAYKNTMKRLNISLSNNDTITYGCQPSNLAVWWLATDTYKPEYTMTPYSFEQRYAIVVFYLSLMIDTKTEENSWLTNTSECEWSGVSCSRFQKIFRLQLNHRGLSGSLPTELSLLRNLREISLESNRLTGTLPRDLFIELKSLRYLDLKGNQFRGPIPEFFNVTDVIIQGIQYNSSAVNPMPDFPNLNVEQIVEDETLVFQLLDDFGNKSFTNQLVRVDLADNVFTGRLPYSFAFSKNIRVLNLKNNKLNANIIKYPNPSIFTQLEVFNVADNQLQGEFPTGFGKLQDLEILDISNNNLYGLLPTEIGNLSELRILNVAGNINLSGTVPTEIARLHQLEYLNLSFTNLSGTFPASICDELVLLIDAEIDCKRLEDLDNHPCPCCICSSSS